MTEEPLATKYTSGLMYLIQQHVLLYYVFFLDKVCYLALEQKRWSFGLHLSWDLIGQKRQWSNINNHQLKSSQLREKHHWLTWQPTIRWVVEVFKLILLSFRNLKWLSAKQNLLMTIIWLWSLFHLFWVQKSQSSYPYATEVSFWWNQKRQSKDLLWWSKKSLPPSIEITEKMKLILEEFKRVVHDKLSEELSPMRDM